MENIEERAVDSASPTSATHARQYLESDGVAVDHPAVGSLILLYTTGRISGETRRTPLRFFEVGDDLMVAASYRGSDSHPHWYLNLIEHPDVWVRRDADLYKASAVPVETSERDRLWESVVVLRAPQFADYQANTKRTIPLVRLVADADQHS
ncbi:MAG TPA: nitroreductase/quinone reductase family protein [Acidimicrobiia bacterium]|nr:nitroreductase/quinone reductase family protein [Acidimicrobiia bacterium]